MSFIARFQRKYAPKDEKLKRILSETGRLDKLQQLLKESPVDFRTFRFGTGITPLQLAVATNFLHIVQYLVVEHRVNVNDLSDMGFTALHVACQRNLVDVAMYLVGVGGRIDIEDANENTPLEVCISPDLKRILADEADRFKRAGLANLVNTPSNSPEKPGTNERNDHNNNDDDDESVDIVRAPSGGVKIAAKLQQRAVSKQREPMTVMGAQPPLAIPPPPAYPHPLDALASGGSKFSGPGSATATLPSQSTTATAVPQQLVAVGGDTANHVASGESKGSDSKLILPSTGIPRLPPPPPPPPIAPVVAKVAEAVESKSVMQSTQGLAAATTTTTTPASLSAPAPGMSKKPSLSLLRSSGGSPRSNSNSSNSSTTMLDDFVEHDEAPATAAAATTVAAAAAAENKASGGFLPSKKSASTVDGSAVADGSTLMTHPAVPSSKAPPPAPAISAAEEEWRAVRERMLQKRNSKHQLGVEESVESNAAIATAATNTSVAATAGATATTTAAAAVANAPVATTTTATATIAATTKSPASSHDVPNPPPLIVESSEKNGLAPVSPVRVATQKPEILSTSGKDDAPVVPLPVPVVAVATLTRSPVAASTPVAPVIAVVPPLTAQVKSTTSTAVATAKPKPAAIPQNQIHALSEVSQEEKASAHGGGGGGGGGVVEIGDDEEKQGQKDRIDEEEDEDEDDEEEEEDDEGFDDQEEEEEEEDDDDEEEEEEEEEEDDEDYGDFEEEDKDNDDDNDDVDEHRGHIDVEDVRMEDIYPLEGTSLSSLTTPSPTCFVPSPSSLCSHVSPSACSCPFLRFYPWII